MLRATSSLATGWRGAPGAVRAPIARQRRSARDIYPRRFRGSLPGRRRWWVPGLSRLFDTWMGSSLRMEGRRNGHARCRQLRRRRGQRQRAKPLLLGSRAARS
eukprot:7290736-Pyramimonas_sp.AAC.1